MNQYRLANFGGNSNLFPRAKHFLPPSIVGCWLIGVGFNRSSSNSPHLLIGFSVYFHVGRLASSSDLIYFFFKQQFLFSFTDDFFFRCHFGFSTGLYCRLIR